MPDDERSLDLIGIGKLAKAIPASVYTQTTDTILTTFERLIAPITETTHGLGRYIRQKFENMVDVEKSLFLYSLHNAQKKLEQKDIKVDYFKYPKTMIRIMEEVSKETDPLLNVLWTNLLCSQLEYQKDHPFFVNILSSLSAKEALLLESLNSFEDIGDIAKSVLIRPHAITCWTRKDGDNVEPWDISCSLLVEFGLASTITPLRRKSGDGLVILYRSDIGEEFLEAVQY